MRLLKTATRFGVGLKDLHGGIAQHRGSCKNGQKVFKVGLRLISVHDEVLGAWYCCEFLRHQSTDGNLPSTVNHIEEVKLGDRVLFVLEEMNHSRSHSDHEVVFVDQ